jgi:universal stress protein A
MRIDSPLTSPVLFKARAWRNAAFCAISAEKFASRGPAPESLAPSHDQAAPDGPGIGVESIGAREDAMPSFRNVLVPVDLTQSSAPAVARATAIAHACGARLTVLHVSPSRISDDARDERLACLADLAAPAYGLDVPPQLVVRTGDPATTILTEAAETAADLIVLPRRHRGLERLLVESIGERVTREARASVLALEEAPSTEVEAHAAPARVLCALDLTESSAGTLGIAVALARDTRSALTVLHVVDPWHWPDPQPLGRQEVAEVHSRLAWSGYERLAALLSPYDSPLDVDTRVPFGSAPVEIVRAISAVEATLIVVGAHSQRLLGHAFLGSTAVHVLQHAPCAVLLARPPMGAETEARRPRDDNAANKTPALVSG